jgi:hypothetical protein
VSLGGFTDDFDAITLANRVAALDGFFAEGGVRNVARVDGLGTTMLSAVEAIGRLPHYYLQAIGSGAGGIGVYETARRVVADGRFGERLPRLLLSQNMPFVPMYLSWKAGRRALVEIDAGDGKKQIQQIAAHVLSNRRPPYAVRGGVYDILTETRGDMLAADNLEVLHAGGVRHAPQGGAVRAHRAHGDRAAEYHGRRAMPAAPGPDTRPRSPRARPERARSGAGGDARPDRRPIRLTVAPAAVPAIPSIEHDPAAELPEARSQPGKREAPKGAEKTGEPQACLASSSAQRA